MHLLSPINHITRDTAIAAVNNENISVSRVTLLPPGSLNNGVTPAFEKSIFMSTATTITGVAAISVLTASRLFIIKANNAEQTRAVAIKTGFCTIAVISITDRKYTAAVTGCVLSIFPPYYRS